MKNVNVDTPDQAALKFEIDGKKQSAHHTWFRGENCYFNPKKANMRQASDISEHLLTGWLPESPPITRDTTIVAFGSCFASNITRWLSRRNFSVLTDKEGEAADAYVVRFGEGMVNTFVIRQQFEWAFENKVFDAELWHGYDASAFGYDEEVRIKTYDMFMQSDVFILTLGLSEIWYDEVSGGVFWRAVPEDKYDPDRHKFRVSSVAENKENLRVIYSLIKKYRPSAKVIFTLSPIPLVATFRPVSCLTANAVSKAVLRAAIDEVLREIDQPESLYYWPSYEIVMDVFADRWKPDRRHVKQPILDFIMTLFETYWCDDSEPEISLDEAWLRARAATGSLNRKLPQLLMQGSPEKLEAIYTRLKALNEGQEAKLLSVVAREISTRDPESAAAKWLAAR